MGDPIVPTAPSDPQAGSPAASQQSTPGDQDARLQRAKKQVAAIKGFYIHLGVFILVLAGLLAINAAGGGSWWVQWVFLGWGIGVVAHALAVFGRAPRAVANWEEKKVKQLANQR
jgi:hypothetical protein